MKSRRQPTEPLAGLQFGIRTVVPLTGIAGRENLVTALGCRADIGDAGLLGAAWDRWGTQVGNHLRGAFAFAVCDRDAVWLVRDPMGEAPLYYARIPGGVVVSAAVAAMVARPDVSDEVDLEAVALRLARCFRECERRTDHRAVAKVPSGVVVRVDRTGVHEHRYWQPGAGGSAEVRGFADAVDMGEDLVRAAVADRLVPGGVAAAHVSGGLDSGVVAAVGAQESRARGESLSALTTWSPHPDSAGFGDPWTDERRLVSATGNAIGVEPSYVDVEEVLAACSAAANPLLDPSAAWLIEQVQAARLADLGVRTVLTGWGGDEGLSHNSRLVTGELVRKGRLPSAWRSTQPPPGRRRSTSSRLRTLAGGALRGRAERSIPGSEAVGGYGSPVDTAWRSYSPDIADARLDQRELHHSGRTTREVMINRMSAGHLMHRNESWATGGGRWGLTYLHPLQDRRVVDFALGLPPECYTYAGRHRRIFRAIAERLLPIEVVAAPKGVGAERARTQLTRRAVTARLPHLRQACDDLGWPPLLTEAWLEMFQPVLRGSARR